MDCSGMPCAPEEDRYAAGANWKPVWQKYLGGPQEQMRRLPRVVILVDQRRDPTRSGMPAARYPPGRCWTPKLRSRSHRRADSPDDDAVRSVQLVLGRLAERDQCGPHGDLHRFNGPAKTRRAEAPGPPPGRPSSHPFQLSSPFLSLLFSPWAEDFQQSSPRNCARQDRRRN